MKKLVPGVAALAALGIAVPLAGAASTTTLKASLNGKSEVPTKGDPDAKGNATVRVKGKQVCWSVSYSKVGTPQAGHIHKGAKGKAGPVVVGLFAAPGKRSGCVNTTSAIAKDLAKNPGRYYVNLHNATYANGAIRGQLHK